MRKRELQRLISEKQLADQWNVSHRTLERWRATGEGPDFYRLGRRVAYDPDEADAWLASRKRTSTSDTGSGDAQRQHA